TSYVQVPLNKYNSTVDFTWYLVDDVSVIESSTIADAGSDTHVGAGDSVYIGRPKEVGLECSWVKLGTSVVIGTGAGIWVKPSVTTSYVVTQTLCGTVTKDTVRVEVWPAGVNSVNGQTQSFGIMPNPNNGVFELVQSVPNDEPASVTVVNAVGQRVFATEVVFKAGKSSLNMRDFPAGMYYLSLKTKGGYQWNMRFVKQ
ncbi:MAG: T9SS type A sorting domain-containing protein, partial [Chitinophagaceae bacterium]